MPKARASILAIIFSGSKRRERTIRAAKFAMRTWNPARCTWAIIVAKPTGYISKTGVEGTRSEIGPQSVARCRKSYTLGAWSKIKSYTD